MPALTLGDGRSTAAPAKRDARWWVEAVRDRATLADRLAAWDDLAWNAVEPNPFYESFLLLPALERFDAQGDVTVALVYRDGVRPQDPPELCGLFPLVTEWHGPLRVWTLWKHIYCFLGTPLVRQGVAVETLRTLWQWLENDAHGPAVWELPRVAADGLFQQALVDVMHERQAVAHIACQYNRAVLRPLETAEAYCSAHMTCHNRQELRRQRRRLGEQGSLTVRQSTLDEDLTPWVEQFLALEAAGWKGREQSALAASAADAQFFRRVVLGEVPHQSSRHDSNSPHSRHAPNSRVGFLGLFLDDRPIALKVNFVSGEGSFAFKIAFDEAFARFSPGVQLELENVDWVHQQRGVKWMDSCAKPDHFMIGRLWGHRRTIQDVFVSTGRRWGDLAVGLMPAAKALRSVLRRKRAPKSSQSLGCVESSKRTEC